jgi:hypothetical protein|eukprot:g5069.t1
MKTILLSSLLVVVTARYGSIGSGTSGSGVFQLATNSTAGAPRILIMGDSWGTISPATKYFELELNNHKCPIEGFTNIAIGGTTAKQWSGALKMAKVKEQAKSHDVIWITLMGNDALAECPGCASSGKTAAECGDSLFASVQKSMTTILDGIHEANPSAKVVGLGYDIMFGGLGCSVIQRDIFPQCWKNKSVSNPVRCFNTELVRIQELWDDLAQKYDFVTAVNILGVTQVAGGDSVAAVGRPNMDKTGPAKYWPITLECIHPSQGATNSGAMAIMDEFYKQFWSNELGC